MAAKQGSAVLSGYVQIKEGNDWGNRYYCLEPLGGKFHTASASRGLRLINGENIPVQLPDGTEYLLPLRLKHHTENISDMGHSYPVPTEIAVLVLFTHGLEHEIPLTAVKVSMDWYEKARARK